MAIATLILGIASFAAAFWRYVLLVRSIWRLVSEARQLCPDRTFSRFFWTGAWKPHRAATPESPLRRQIAMGFVQVWLFMLLGLGCVAFSMYHGLVIP
jgi:hypothetical protein